MKLHPLHKLLAASATLLFPALASAQSTPDHWRVVWQERPAEEAYIVWTTKSPGQAHTVHYGQASSQGQVSSYSQHISQGVESGAYTDEQPAYYHSLKLTGLEPSTAYYFTIETDGEFSPELHFVTAPKDERKFKVLYGGDSRSDRPDRQVMNRRVASIVEGDPEIIALVHGGDYVDDGYSWPQWEEWLDDHELTVTAQGKILPIIAARGNHERDSVLYNYVFADPGGEGKARNYFTTQLAPHVTLFNLDSSDSASGDQRVWLERQLIAEQSTRWLIVNYHIPAWPAVKIQGPARLYWVPLFEQYNVDLVCESDGHVLKRTVPIRNEQQDPTGVVYVGEGGMGVKQREPDTKRWYLQPPGMAMSGHHVQLLTFEPDKLTYQAILEDGSIADEYTRAPRPERMLAAFEVQKTQRAGMNGVELFFSYSLDEDTIIQDDISFDQGVKVTRVTLATDRQRLRVETDGMTPGVEYTIDVGDIRDYSSRPLAQRQIKFLMPGAPPMPDMGGPDLGADMGTTPADMGSARDMGPDMGPTAPPRGAGNEDDGCSAASAKGAPVGFLLFFGAMWFIQRRRQRRLER